MYQNTAMPSEAFRRADALLARLTDTMAVAVEIKGDTAVATVEGGESRPRDIASVAKRDTSTAVAPVAGGPFCARDIAGRGIGLIATRDIEKGELVLQEDPLCVLELSPQRLMLDPEVRPLLLKCLAVVGADRSELNVGSASPEVSETMARVTDIVARRLYATLPADTQRAWLALHDSHAPSTPGGVVRCNSYGFRNGEAAALYRTFCRINHSYARSSPTRRTPAASRGAQRTPTHG